MPRECSGSTPGARPCGPGGAKIIRTSPFEFVELRSLQRLVHDVPPAVEHSWPDSGPLWCPGRGAPAGVAHESHFLGQHEKRDLILRALGTQIPNPGTLQKRDMFYALPRRP
jgi:hypothetical protein